eukprot:3874013-Pyramimonas_sp.AAC.1
MANRCHEVYIFMISERSRKVCIITALSLPNLSPAVHLTVCDRLRVRRRGLPLLDLRMGPRLHSGDR